MYRCLFCWYPWSTTTLIKQAPVVLKCPDCMGQMFRQPTPPTPTRRIGEW